MVSTFAEGAEGVLTGRADAHGGVWLHHHSLAAGLARAVHHISHQIQAGLKQETVITSKQLLPDKELDLYKGQCISRDS